MSLTFYKYRLPFSPPLVTAKSTFKHREGFIIKYSNDGFKCYGEAAPLPGFSVENLNEVEQQITQNKKRLEAVLSAGKPIDLLRELYGKSEIAPSLQFGLDSVAYQVEAFRSGTSLQNFLFDDALPKIPVNALISLRSDDTLAQIKQFITKGFQTIKCKVGLKFDQEYEKLQEIRSQFPNLTIRLDANQAWALDEAVNHLSTLQRLNIEYCEEPLKEPDQKKYQKLNNETGVPLALDESLTQQNDWHSILPFISVLVIKPMLLGSFSKFFVTKRLAESLDLKVVVTSSLESGVGRMTMAILASGLGSGDWAHGLNTGEILATDVLADKSFIAKGMHHLNYYQKWISIEQGNLQKISTAVIK